MLPAMGVLRPFLFALPRGRLYSDARRRLEREGTLQLHTPPGQLRLLIVRRGAPQAAARSRVDWLPSAHKGSNARVYI